MITLRPGIPDGVEVAGGRGSLLAADGGDDVGYAVWQVELGVATVSVIASTAAADRDADILAAVRQQVVQDGLATLTVEVGSDQTGLLEALQDAPVLSTYMTRPAPASPPALPTGFVARAMTATEYAAWKDLAIEGYAASNLARCGGNRELALQRSHESFARFLPDDAATTDTRLLTLTQDGEQVGDLWVRHHWPRYRDASPRDDETFTFDVHITGTRRGEGLGRAAMLAAEVFAIEAGDGQLGLNVFGGNEAAIGLYRDLGYAPRSTVVDVALR